MRPCSRASSRPTCRGSKRIAGDIDAIVLRATAAEPAARYASARSARGRHSPSSRDAAGGRARADADAIAPAVCCAGAGRCSPRALSVALMIAAFTWRLAAERDRALAAEREARVQATAAERVSAFLVSVFDVSNPRAQPEARRQRARRARRGRGTHPERARRPAAREGEAARYARRPRTAISASPRRASIFSARAIDLHLDPRVDEPLEAAAALSQLAVGYANNGYPRKDAEAAARRSLDLRQKNGGEPARHRRCVQLARHRAADARTARRSRGGAARKVSSLRRANGADVEHDRLVAAQSRHRRERTATSTTRALADYREALDAAREDDRRAHARISAHADELRRRARPRRQDRRGGVRARGKPRARARALRRRQRQHGRGRRTSSARVLHDEGRFREAILHYREAMRIDELHRRRERRRARQAAQQSRVGVRGHGRFRGRDSAVPRVARDPHEDARQPTIRWCCAPTTTSGAC